MEKTRTNDPAFSWKEWAVLAAIGGGILVIVSPLVAAGVLGWMSMWHDILHGVGGCQ